MLFLLVMFISADVALAAEVSCAPGQSSLLIQTGLTFDMVWVGFESGKDKGLFKPFQSPVTETTICRWSQQAVHIQESGTHYWYKLIYRDGKLTELEALE